MVCVPSLTLCCTIAMRGIPPTGGNAARVRLLGAGGVGFERGLKESSPRHAGRVAGAVNVCPSVFF